MSYTLVSIMSTLKLEPASSDSLVGILPTPLPINHVICTAPVEIGHSSES